MCACERVRPHGAWVSANEGGSLQSVRCTCTPATPTVHKARHCPLKATAAEGGLDKPRLRLRTFPHAAHGHRHDVGAMRWWRSELQATHKKRVAEATHAVCEACDTRTRNMQRWATLLDCAEAWVAMMPDGQCDAAHRQKRIPPSLAARRTHISCAACQRSQSMDWVTERDAMRAIAHLDYQ